MKTTGNSDRRVYLAITLPGRVFHHDHFSPSNMMSRRLTFISCHVEYKKLTNFFQFFRVGCMRARVVLGRSSPDENKPPERRNALPTVAVPRTTKYVSPVGAPLNPPRPRYRQPKTRASRRVFTAAAGTPRLPARRSSVKTRNRLRLIGLGKYR